LTPGGFRIGLAADGGPADHPPAPRSGRRGASHAAARRDDRGISATPSGRRLLESAQMHHPFLSTATPGRAAKRGTATDKTRELLLEYGNDILFVVDAATLEIRAANGTAARLLGYARDDLVGRPVTDVVLLADHFCRQDVRRRAAPVVHDIETQFLRADGKRLDIARTVVHPAPHLGLLVVCATPAGKPRRAGNDPANTAARLLAALEVTADGLLVLDQGGKIANMNRRFRDIWRIPEELSPGSGHDALVEFMASRARDPDAYKRRLSEIRPDGGETFDLLSLGDGRFLERKSRPAMRGKTVIGRVFSFSDISEHKARESRLALAASVFSHAHEGIMITDGARNIIDVNATFCRITGYAREEIIGQNPRILKSGRQSDDFYRAMWDGLAACGHWEGELWNRHKNGDLYAERLSITAVRDAIDASLHYIAIFTDITELKGYQRRLERMAHYDALTDVPNRVLLADRLNIAIAQARRYSRSLALVYLDIDGFKEINDWYGHETGNQLLITVAQRLRDTLREGDTLARLSGDEFAAVISDLDGQAQYEPILARLLDAVAAPIKVHEDTFRISASLGVTLFPRDDSNADTLLRHAAQSMYQAKQAGKNCYRLFDPEKERQTLTHNKSLNQIAQALVQNQFVPYFQPKVNMRTGAVVGAEVLLRWQHPERGLVPPGEFLPLIKGSDLVARLGDWVLDAALTQMTAWSGRGLDIAVSVNISARHLQQADFLPNLEQKLAAHPAVESGRLELEILETEALEEIARIFSLMEDCQALGVRFSLDDFGTGYSSLAYLRRLPANVLKIDQSFVRNMLSNSGDLAIVEAIIGLAAAFDRTVIAEGVETTEHGELLLRLGCDLAQGYCIARPMPAGELPAWLTTWHPPPAWSGGRGGVA
jgi:diguanylate cyclase (GGDEF)-like protein/PAS domain S-box-containing protein